MLPLNLSPPPPVEQITPCPPMMESKVTLWSNWNNTQMLRCLMRLRPVPPRQSPETWKEWTRVQLLDADITFMQQTLWPKLPVGTRLARWQPHGTACPLDGQHETPQHALLHCLFLPVAFRLVCQCMGPVSLDAGSTDDPEEILHTMPSLSLSSLLGLVMWSAVHASWRLRCSANFDPQLGPPTWKHFLWLWIDTLVPWLEHPSPTLPHSEITTLLHGLCQLNGPDGLMDHPRAQ